MLNIDDEMMIVRFGECELRVRAQRPRRDS